MGRRDFVGVFIRAAVWPVAARADAVKRLSEMTDVYGLHEHRVDNSSWQPCFDH